MSKVAVGYNGKLGDGTLTLIIKGRAHQVIQDHPNRKAIVELLNKDDVEDQILALLQEQKSVLADKLNDASFGKVVVANGVVTYNGKPVHNLLSERILQFQKEGLPFEPLVKFMEKLEQNPSSKSREDLYDFLEHKNLPIAEDGDFFAYKAIREDWMDKYSGTIDNSIGQEISIERRLVDDNHDRHCSAGLHCGAMDYVCWYGSSDDRVVIVKVNPRDAVSVPRDHRFMKLRTCRYVVVKEYEGNLQGALYDNNAIRIGEDEEDFEDEEWIDRVFGGSEDEYDGADDEAEEDYDDEDEGDDNFGEGEVRSMKIGNKGIVATVMTFFGK